MRPLPGFELVTFPFDPALQADGIDRDVRRSLAVEGVPREFFGRRYTAAAVLTPMRVPPNTHLILFGSVMGFGAIGVDAIGGRVFDLSPPGLPTFVNSSLAQFTETVKRLIDRFPFYDRSANDEAVERVGEELTNIVGGIDPGALTVDQFWSTFLDDVILLRDFATEDVLGPD